MVDMNSLLDEVCIIARQAGYVSMQYYQDFVKPMYKVDDSPVTDADIKANQHIVQALQQLTPDIPIVSEEGKLDHIPKTTQSFWLVDPLDGTKDFLEHNDEFTVNIALISDARPVLGVVYAPALATLYYGTVGHNAWKQVGDRQPQLINNAGRKRLLPGVVVSRHHLDADTKIWLQAADSRQIRAVGSSLKLCYLADGTADLYPRLSPLMQWDIAAADAILQISGGAIVQCKDGQQPVYLPGQLKQTPFIAVGCQVNRPRSLNAYRSYLALLQVQ